MSITAAVAFPAVGGVASDFTLPSVDGGPVRLSELVSTTSVRSVLLLFVHADCRTSLLALERLAATEDALASAGIELVCIAQERAEVAARLARRSGLRGRMLAEPAPYETSAAYGVATVPTGVLLADGHEPETLVGWDSDAYERALAVRLPEGEPRWKPGCESRSVLDAELLAGLSSFDEHEDMFERGWTDGLPVVPPTPRARRGDARRARPRRRRSGPCRPAWARRRSSASRPARCSRAAGPRTSPSCWRRPRLRSTRRSTCNGQAVTTSPPGQVIDRQRARPRRESA